MVEGILIGAVIAIIFCAKPLNVFIKELSDQSPGVFAYILLCLAFLFSSWWLGWIGFTCVMATFVLYQIGAEGIQERWAKFRSFLGQFKFRREQPEPDPEDAEVSTVEDEENQS